MPESPAGPTVRARALGRWATNCVLVGDRASGRVVVVDPGEGAEDAVPAWVAALGLEVEAIVLTHGHLDHLWGAPGLADALDVPVHLHPDDRWLWDAPGAAFGAGPEVAAALGLGPWSADPARLVPLADGQVLRLGGVVLRIHHTPGHTPGHVVVVVEGAAGAPVELDGSARTAGSGVLLSGDLLFAGSIGRTDLVGGDPGAMDASLGRVAGSFDDEVLVLPGHGPMTTIGRERRANPFLRTRTSAGPERRPDAGAGR